jgi:hypothetical protein
LEIFPAYQAGGGVVGGVHHLADFFAGHSHELVAEFDFAGCQLVGVGHALRLSASRTYCKNYFPHCGFIFAVYSSAMSFDTDLADYTAAQIIAALGCPRSTAYEWKDGRRQPPAWLHPILLAVIAREAKRHNKTLMPTDTSRAAGSRKRRS